MINPKLIKELTVRINRPEIYDHLRVLYPKLHEKKISKKLRLSFLQPSSSPSFVDLKIKYVDTFLLDNNTNLNLNHNNKQQDYNYLTVVAIHGCPGNYNHFKQLINHYCNNSLQQYQQLYHHQQKQQKQPSHLLPPVRVIVPNMPDFTHTRYLYHQYHCNNSNKNIFWHTTIEKTLFLQSFLCQLNIKQIDCLVSHSLGFQTVTALTAEQTSKHNHDHHHAIFEPDKNNNEDHLNNNAQIRIRSLALMSPTPLWGQLLPKELIMNKIFQYVFKKFPSFWYSIFESGRIHRLPIWPVKFANIDEYLLFSIIQLDHLTNKDAKQRIDYIRDCTTIPVTVLYGSADPVIDKCSMNGIYDRLGIRPDKIIHIDYPDDYDPVNESFVNNQRFNGYMITGGGHFVHAKYANISNRIVDNLLLSLSSSSN